MMHGSGHSKFHHPVTFVRGKASDEESASWIAPKAKQWLGNLDGKDVKDFYESIVSEASTSGAKQGSIADKKTRIKDASKSKKITKKQTTIKHKNQDRLQAQFLKYAQEGDFKSLVTCLNDGVDINCTDRFGWNAIMCAGHAGHLKIVKHLIQHGIDSDALDKQGRSVIMISAAAKQNHVTTYLRKISSTDYNQEEDLSYKDANIKNEFFCPDCKKEFRETTMESHRTSTLHLLNTKTDMPATMYHIPESNVGYKLMVKSGWDKEYGLGPSGEGNKFPVKTVLKRNRSGLGTDKESRPKVTHFGANDEKAVEREKVKKKRLENTRTLNKKARKKALSKKQQWERNLRQYMN